MVICQSKHHFTVGWVFVGQQGTSQSQIKCLNEFFGELKKKKKKRPYFPVNTIAWIQWAFTEEQVDASNPKELLSQYYMMIKYAGPCSTSGQLRVGDVLMPCLREPCIYYSAVSKVSIQLKLNFSIRCSHRSLNTTDENQWWWQSCFTFIFLSQTETN